METSSFHASEIQNTNQDTALRILSFIFKYRRSLEDAHEKRHFCEQCNHPHLEKIESYINSRKKIVFVLPAFPAKSPNLKKVLGELPDLGEEIALKFLHSLCDRIQEIYPPGAQVILCSDGHVFSDLVGVPDTTVSQYLHTLKTMTDQLHLSNISFFALENSIQTNNYDSMRVQLENQFGQTLDEIHTLTQQSPREKIMVNGLERFLFEDYLFLRPDQSRNSIRKFCHSLAYQVLQRSHAWSNVVSQHYPNAIRLSIHPQPCHYEKLGISLVPSSVGTYHDNWITPWHGVAVKNLDGSHTLMKRSQAEELEALIEFKNGQPWNFSQRSSIQNH